jgi:polysaccharide export outer membrane protein
MGPVFVRKWPLSLILLSALGACAGNRTYAADPQIQLAGTDGLPAPGVSDIYGRQRPYLIGPLDKLDIKVFGVEDLSLKVQTDASGRISMPLAGVIEAAGKSPAEVASAIEAGLRGRYIRNPQVTVNLEDTVSQVITVDGEVKEPGIYPVVGKMSLMRSIATAKGTSEFAALQDVVIFRTVQGQKYAGVYNLKAIRQGNYADPEVFPGDVIVVGDSQARRLFRDVVQVAPAILSPLVFLLTSNR